MVKTRERDNRTEVTLKYVGSIEWQNEFVNKKAIHSEHTRAYDSIAENYKGRLRQESKCIAQKEQEEEMVEML